MWQLGTDITTALTTFSGGMGCQFMWIQISVLCDPKLFFSDPDSDPTFQEISDPDPISDPT